MTATEVLYMRDDTRLAGAPLRGKKVLILGLARSGQAAARLVEAAGGVPFLYDRRPAEKFEDLSFLEQLKTAQRHMGVPIEPLLKLCDFAVFSPGIPPDAPDMAAAAKALPLVSELEFASGFVPCPMLAVTGTNGKTTTVSLLKNMLQNAGFVAYAAGNIGYPLSMAALQAGRDDRIVAEVSSFQLESTDTFRPAIAAVLNITPDHLDRHGSMAAYIELKKRIFLRMDKDDTAVLNADDTIVAGFADALPMRASWFSASHPVEQGAYFNGGHIVVRWDGEERTVCPRSDFPLPGRHNLENALAAAAMAYAAGVPVPVIRHSLRTFEGVEHRIEFVAAVRGVRYINDSKGTNPDSTIKAVEAMDSPTVLLLGGYDKKVSFDQLAGVIKASPFIRAVVTLGQAGQAIQEALSRAGYGTVLRVETLEEAVMEAAREAKAGGAVLFSPACASFDQFKDYEQRGRVFKAIVRRLADEEK